METAMAFFSGILLPASLLGAGIFFGVRLRFFWFLHPIRTFRTLFRRTEKNTASPFAALTVALAGTLGVGNIAGVAAAITAGGAGAVFWMLAGALFAMPVKYAEVYLALRFRRYRREDGRLTPFGGAMYYIRDGLGEQARTAFGRETAARLGGLFALFCVLNALITGNVLQVRAAVSCTDIPPVLFGILFAALALPAMRGGMRRLSGITVVLIPILSVIYVLLSGTILIAYRAEIPRILGEIFREAFGLSAVGGGVLGLSVRRAVRFGITRGLFSNEAGCGTSPTAHAASDARDPHHQGCFGIFEVFADTVLLCTLTALVILLYRDGAGLDGMALSLAAYTKLALSVGGVRLASAAGLFMRLAVILFAFATVIAQSSYGTEALRYFLPPRRAKAVFTLLSAAGIFMGAILPEGVLWQWADLVLSGMTVLNVICLLCLHRQISPPK